jgi:phenylalanyl-tRNA synthetase beta chain
LISDVRLFDIYRGQGITAGHKSLAISVLLQPQDKTLTDADIEAISQKIIAEVKKKTGGALRL